MAAPLGNNNADGPHKKHHGGRKKGSHIVHHKAHGNKAHKAHKAAKEPAINPNPKP